MTDVTEPLDYRAWMGVTGIPEAATIMVMDAALPDDLHELQDAYPMRWGLWVGAGRTAMTLPS